MKTSYCSSILIELLQNHSLMSDEKQFEKVNFYGFSSISNSIDGTLSWMKSQDLDWGEVNSAIVICSDKFTPPDNSKILFLPVSNPRLAYTLALREFVREKPIGKIESTAIIGNNCSISENVYIGHYSIIGDNVSIGEDTVVDHHVVIRKNVKIGEKCLIKSHSVIGEIGFGFEFEGDIPLRIPHLGSVKIGDHVSIGANAVITQGTIDNTVINDYAQIDDLVHIAHNVIVGKSAFVIGTAEVAGGVVIGEKAWIGPNSSIKNGINIGTNALLGMGAVVMKDVPENAIVAGNPARQFGKKDT